VAVRDIQPGEELFVDYGTSYTEPWKDEFDRIIKGLRNLKSIDKVLGGDEQPKEQLSEYIENGKTCEVTKGDLQGTNKVHSS